MGGMITFALPMQYIFSPATGPLGLYAWFPAMHTRVDLLLADRRPKEKLLAIAGEVETLVGHIEKLANRFDPTSPLSRHNADERYPVPDELQEILDSCRHYKELTGGLFDPWYGGPCDLSGFLKGYALDRIRRLLEHHQVEQTVVSMGNSSIMKHGAFLTTSGNDSPTRRHIVSPLTGEYVTGQRTVSVATSSGAVGEVLSTALFIADDEQRRLLLSRFPEAHIIAEADRDEWLARR